MQHADLLIELGTEELPPKALLSLRDAFVEEFIAQLDDAGFTYGDVERFASPRRLAFRIRDLLTSQPDKQVERRGPAVKAAFDADGNPTKAAQGFAKSVGLDVAQLDRLSTDKGEWLVAHINQQGKQLAEVAEAYLAQAIQRLPIPKRMHWGSRRAMFVRPVHWLVALLDDAVLPLSVLGQQSGRDTHGHRCYHDAPIAIPHAKDYDQLLRGQGRVEPVFETRRELIATKAKQLGEEAGGITHIDPDLLDEVSALVELPVPLMGRFEEHYLRVPQEALISTMEGDQKYFPVLDANGKLRNAFVFVSNIDSPKPELVIAGNERVVRPRLADAEFFYDTDRKKTLAEHAKPLDRVVFQKQLGTLADKAERVAGIAALIADALQGDATIAAQAARLAKADLNSGMVGEFDKMQGIMGRYLAEEEGLPTELAQAMEEQYLPRYSGDKLPQTVTGQALALADKLDTLVGIFGIGNKPSGTKDPFALRRATLGILRIVVEQQLPLDLQALVEKAIELLADRITESDARDALDFIYGRYRAFYQDKGFSTPLIQAVEVVRPHLPLDLDKRIHALADFQQQPACAALAAANKRVANILAKQAPDLSEGVNAALLQEKAEKALFEALDALPAEAKDYATRLNNLAGLHEAVDTFFEDVMVMADDEALRTNRLRLLASLRQKFLEVADISLLD